MSVLGKNRAISVQAQGKAKRLLDVVGAGVGLLVLSPVIGGIALAVMVRHGRPVFFSQTRPGLHGKPFRMFKFRTMTNDCGADGQLLPDGERLTRLGSFLRSTSLDELPELWNVLRGDMSLVGPRPLLMEYLDYYTDEERLRHCVRPGITGLAQVSGRNSSRWDERLAVDVEYVRNQSLLLDLKILFRTVFQVLRRQGVVVVPSTLYRKLSDERRERDS